ncbi:MAG: hypothetical protein CMH66_02745 [Nioella sp.]|nr:hypothetical protein [Nioella sp.]
MPEALQTVLATPGLVWIVVAAVAAGVVRGFSGFGTAMVFLPVAGQFLSPVTALVAMTVMDIFGPLPHVPRALKHAHRRDIVRLCAGLVVALPLGLWVLVTIPAEVFRYGVSSISLVLLVLLMMGWRYRGEVRRGMIYLTGMLGGLFGGAAGLAGPPVIMIYMARPLPAPVVRANLMLYLIGADALMMAMLGAGGRLSLVAVMTGLVVTLPYLAGNLIGAWLFRPDHERAYRWAAYAIIAVSALSGLPLWD